MFFRLPFNQFATNEAIRKSEIYEYAVSMGTSYPGLTSSLLVLQPYKLIYACRLMERGLITQVSFHDIIN